jgi:lipopolysaccharide export LptBFGC system permease protein LptF
MNRTGLLISKYLVRAILPYFASAWLLLSVILFVQQASRYSDIFFNVNIPANLIWQLAFALLPNVIAFTCPMAILVGTIIGLAKMQGDSELVAIRASGVGNLQIALPIIILGILLSIFAFVVNLKGVPLAASLVRNVALQTAIKKLESPIEPGVFNTEVAGYTIYVKSGDIETGRWENIFIYGEDAANSSVRLITSRAGRIDTSGETSELVLENASVTTLPLSFGEGKYVAENLGQIRLAIKTSRSELIKKLSSSDLAPEELGLQQLSDYAAEKGGKERNEALILQQRRLLLSITPLIFCILGTVIVLRFNRGGRGFGIAVALIVLIGFYLLAFLGEQLARTGAIGVYTSALLPIGGSIAAIIWFALTRRLDVIHTIADKLKSLFTSFRRSPQKIHKRDIFVDLTTGLRDFDIIRNLVKNFLLALCFLTAIFVIFTAFELWKFAGTIDGGFLLLVKYLFFLLPFVYLQIAPSAAMIATLATYAIKSRQNEIVTWTSAGQSVYRLLLPCFLLAFLLGAVNWVIQENVLPGFNKKQDAIRNQIRNNGKPENVSGKLWVANTQRIYSFKTLESDKDKNQPSIIFASDNEIRECGSNCVLDVSAYEFADKVGELQSVYRSEAAKWSDGKLIFIGNVERNELIDGKIVNSSQSNLELTEKENPFTQVRVKPTHLDSGLLKDQIEMADSDLEKRNLTVALQKKYSVVLLPLVIALFTAPFSLTLNRKGKVATIGFAVALWLLFTGVSSVFEQLGLNGLLSPSLAVWSPLFIFTFIGLYLLSKLRT